MKFSSIALLLIATSSALTASAFTQSSAFGVRSQSGLFMSEATEEEAKVSKKNKRLQFMKDDQFYRNGFKDVRKDVEDVMEGQFKSKLVDDMKENKHIVEREGVRVHLASDFGFCWGVERSIALAYEAVKHFPDRKVHITNELIHNPEVNDNLGNMEVNFIEKTADGKDFSVVGEKDVVILPAFGASFEEMQLFNEKDVEIVDTTCPWVSKVWNTVDTHQKKGLTSIIHGKYAHEETVATVSFCEDYLCVKNMEEAEMVADYILNGGDKPAFMKHFKNAVSDGFDPDTMLSNLGLANQTTMYKKETRAIGKMLQKTMLEKFGPVDAETHYMEFDTICDATQVSSQHCLLKTIINLP
uniref:4-hydroxy-3-methylbut-2-enyl diphosphate reductase n=1 Tax=Chaetoceros debilis TaxID=122233 RepID=A0A7S3V8X8_9STRA